MSNSAQGDIAFELEMVNTLPAYSEQPESEQLYVSFSELISDTVFYHPALKQEELSSADSATLSTLLNGNSLQDHFVSTLYSEIKKSIKPSHKVIRVSLSNMDSYEFGALLGGECESKEINPAIGLRGVVRYVSDLYASSFALECEVIKRLRQEGYDIEAVVPFVRTMSDAATIIDRLAVQGLPRGLNGFKLHYSCDVPSSILLADKILPYFDGVVVNLANLAQFTLGIDNKNEALEHSFDLQNEAVTKLMIQLIKKAKKTGKPCLILSPNLDAYPVLKEVMLEHKEICVAVMG